MYIIYGLHAHIFKIFEYHMMKCFTMNKIDQLVPYALI